MKLVTLINQSDFAWAAQYGLLIFSPQPDVYKCQTFLVFALLMSPLKTFKGGGGEGGRKVEEGKEAS